MDHRNLPRPTKANLLVAASTMTTDGVTVLVNLTRLSSAVWLSPVYAVISEVTRWVPTPLAWLKSFCSSGVSLLDDAGGKVSSLRMSQALKASLRSGSEEYGPLR